MKRVKAYPETHIQGWITCENKVEFPLEGDIGVMVSEDGRVWVCINGIAFLRVTPWENKKMSKGE
jgi:hypothetical protein